jgi:TolA-binding protein
MVKERLKMQNEKEYQHPFEKTISITHILTTISMAVSMIWWASTVETRITVNRTLIEAGSTQLMRAADDSKGQRAEMRDQLSDINQKLDRIVERQMANRQ